MLQHMQWRGSFLVVLLLAGGTEDEVSKGNPVLGRLPCPLSTAGDGLLIGCHGHGEASEYLVTNFSFFNRLALHCVRAW